MIDSHRHAYIGVARQLHDPMSSPFLVHPLYGKLYCRRATVHCAGEPRSRIFAKGFLEAAHYFIGHISNLAALHVDHGGITAPGATPTPTAMSAPSPTWTPPHRCAPGAMWTKSSSSQS